MRRAERAIPLPRPHSQSRGLHLLHHLFQALYLRVQSVDHSLPEPWPPVPDDGQRLRVHLRRNRSDVKAAGSKKLLGVFVQGNECHESYVPPNLNFRSYSASKSRHLDHAHDRSRQLRDPS